MSRPATLTLVVNPAAGGGRARRILPKITAALMAGLPETELRVQQAGTVDEADQLCQEAVAAARSGDGRASTGSLVVVGGDGMMHLGINACAGTSVPLGLIGAGRGNDFCRGVGVPSDPARAVATIVEGHLLRMDLMQATGKLIGGSTRWVGSIVSTGFDARVNYRTNQQTKNLGQLSYVWAALAELRRFEPLNYRLEIDGVRRDLPAMFIAVGNAGWFGGGMQGCVDADITDGLLDLTIVHPVSRLTLLRLLPRMFDGGYVRDPAIERLRGRVVEVDGDGLYAMADGEELGPVPLRLQAVPEVLSVYVPATSAPRRGS